MKNSATMTDPSSNPAMSGVGTVRRAGNSTLCPSCERLNPLGLEKCDRCGVDLFVDCGQCGARNARTSTRCPKCGHRQGQVRRNQWNSLLHSPVLWAIAVTGIGIVMALALLIWLGGGRLPRI